MHDREVPTSEVRHEGEARPSDRRAPSADGGQIREADLQPYVALRYVARLFRLIAIVVLFLLLAEVITGLRLEGTDAIFGLLVESGRLLVMAGILWAAADLAILLVDVGHDVRAIHIVLGRLERHVQSAPLRADPHAYPVVEQEQELR
ncbi:MAG TPA: hypothetical protein VFK13_13565 [Gemmatimonadaceae bacterium]|nr:hypothetical protein [Gemmatimonadaceae bacterium]